MNPKFTDDRLSAFVDGTLSTTEAAELRRELERSPELATLVAELRQVRSEVQSLPRLRAPEGFAARVMAKIAAAQQETEPVSPLSPPTKLKLNHWSSFALGAVAASLVLVLLSYVLPRGGDDLAGNKVRETIIPTINTPPQPRTIDLLNLNAALSQATAKNEMFVARLTVRNSALMQGSLEQSLTKNNVTVTGSLENETALKTAAQAYKKSVADEEPRVVREVLYLVGTDVQVRDALKSLAEQPMDVANLQDKVLGIPAEQLLAEAPAVVSQNRGLAVRVGQKQLFKALDKQVGEGEGEADPNSSSDVLVVIRIVK